jgi:tripartite-type tricarboxylate transporter receptor subunit TctC
MECTTQSTLGNVRRAGKRNRALTFAVAALWALSALAATAAAQAQTAPYPVKSVRLIVPFAAGGSTDSAARVLATQLEKSWKQTIIVEARPGGNQIVGTDYVVHQSNDGYVLLMAAGPIMYEHLLNKDCPFVGQRDLVSIAMVTGAGLIVGVPPSLPVRNFGELVAYIRANPGKVNWATTGSLPASLEALRHQLQLADKVVDVAYKGGNLGMAAVAAGDAQVFAGSPLDGLELIRAGRIRAIAYTEKTRHPLYPDVPTIAESNVGAPDHRSGFWFGIFAPAGLAPAIVTYINATVNEATRAPEVMEKYRFLGMQPYSLSPQEMAQSIDSEVKGVATLLAQGVKLR